MLKTCQISQIPVTKMKMQISKFSKLINLFFPWSCQKTHDFLMIVDILNNPLKKLSIKGLLMDPEAFRNSWTDKIKVTILKNNSLASVDKYIDGNNPENQPNQFFNQYLRTSLSNTSSPNFVFNVKRI